LSPYGKSNVLSMVSGSGAVPSRRDDNDAYLERDKDGDEKASISFGLNLGGPSWAEA